jgi:leucyl-tRNA---protein transferase
VQGLVFDCGPCPYLPGQRFHAFHPAVGEPLPPYRRLMDHGFRRSGAQFYAPLCPGCSACRPIRVDALAFRPRRDQRRCAARNRDLTISFAARGLDAERGALFQRYQTAVHDRDAIPDAGFLVDDGGVAGGELHARDAAGRLLAVSIIDRFGDALSSVYCYYDPDERARGLGTFMVLSELAHCQALGLPWLYLGFLVRACTKMAYKARFLPHEVREADGAWVRYD